MLGLAALLLLAHSCRAQQVRIAGRVLDSQAATGVPGATVLLKHDTVQVAGAGTNQDGFFVLPVVPVGVYQVQVQLISYRIKTVRYVAAVSNPAPLQILLPGFCPYSSRGKPECVGGHTNHLLPIAYGLPSARTMARAKAGKIYLGGCEVTGCDPRYYCPIHKQLL